MIQKSYLLLLAVLAVNVSAARADDEIPPIIDASSVKDGQNGNPVLDPCDDFYQFACGGWLDKTVIPADKTSVNRQVTAATDSTDKTLNKILEAYSKGDFSIPSSYPKKLRDFYTSCMNVDQESPVAIKEIKRSLAKMRRIKKSGASLARLVAHMQSSGSGPFFWFGSSQDLNDSESVIGDIGQSGIAMGQRDYYLNTDDKSKEILSHYRDHIGKMFTLVGVSETQAKQNADTVLRIETALATASYGLADQGNPAKTLHPVALADLKKASPHFDWASFFHTLRFTHVKHLNLDEPEFLAAVDQQITSNSAADLEVYLEWNLINNLGGAVGGEFEKENFAFWHAYLNGAKQMKPRWKICTQAVEGSLGYMLAEAYVKTFDGKAIKEKTEAMITDIKASFANELSSITRGQAAWMDEATMTQALAKLNTIRQKVGAPEKWRNYQTLRTYKNSYLKNNLALAKFESHRDLAKVGKPVDHSEWGMMPWEVNAYYDRSNNEFNFPFGILQPPSLDLAASDGTNLGAFGGGTIGHELTHGFDNNGSQYDAKGNVVNWWSDVTLDKFSKKTACYIKQAGEYPVDGVDLKVSGENTLEENLADQGGVRLGYAALNKVLEGRAQSPNWNKLYSERQQYWIAYAQSWCTKITPEQLRERMTTDVHPPADFRVNVVLMNQPEFAKDFGCKDGSKMAPTNRCDLW